MSKDSPLSPREVKKLVYSSLGNQFPRSKYYARVCKQETDVNGALFRKVFIIPRGKENKSSAVETLAVYASNPRTWKSAKVPSGPYIKRGGRPIAPLHHQSMST